MKTGLQAQAKAPSQLAFTPVQIGLLQRKCACGGSAGLGGQCDQCQTKKLLGLQTKLTVGEPGDVYEREADRIADQMMATPAPPTVSGVPPRIQRLAGQSNGQMDAAPASVDQVLASPGRPLEPALRQDMEQRFGHDFSRVRVHSGSAAEQSAQDISANAYTAGNNIVFGADRFAPGTQEGRRLIAHELTHVVQQSGADGIRVNQSDEKRGLSPISPRPSEFISRDVSPPHVPMALPEKEEVVELKGKRYFQPSAALEKSIKSSTGTTWISVKFGKIASGLLPVRFEKDGYTTEDPLTHLGVHPLEVTHESFRKLPGAIPYIFIRVRKGEVEGFLGWKVVPQFLAPAPWEELFGWDGLTDVFTTKPVESVLRDGQLRYSLPAFKFRNGVYEGTGKFELLDETATFDAGVDVKVTGLPSAARIPVKQERGALHGLYGSKTWSFDRGIGKAGKDDDTPARIHGSLTATLVGGSIDIRGTARYTRGKPRIDGSVTLVIADLNTVRQAVGAKLGKDAPPKVDPAASGEKLAITGWGILDFAFNEWLTGRAEVFVHPEGWITTRGALAPTKGIELFEEKTKEKPLVEPLEYPFPAWGIIVGGEITAELDAFTSFGPGTFHDMRIEGLYSTHPLIGTRFELSGTASAPAVIGLRGRAKGEIRAKIVTDVVTIASAGVTILGELDLKMYLEAQAKAGVRGLPDRKQYYLQGTIEAAAAIELALHVWFQGTVAFWTGKISAVDRVYELASGGVSAGFEYVFGKQGAGLMVHAGSTGFSGTKFAEAVLWGKKVKNAKEKKAAAKWEDQVSNPAAPAPPALPPSVTGGPLALPPAGGSTTAPTPAATPSVAPGAPVPPPRVLEEPFEMQAVHHLLRLSLSTTPELEMESDPPVRRLRDKVTRAMRRVRESTTLSPEQKSTQLKDLAKIREQANEVLATATLAAGLPSYAQTTGLRGFKDLAQLIHEYGLRYKKDDLVETLAESIGVGDLESILAAFPNLQRDSKALALVREVLGTQKVFSTELRLIMDNVQRTTWSPRSDKEEVARSLLSILKNMLTSGAINVDAVITELAGTGNFPKGAEWVIRYIDRKKWWSSQIVFEVHASEDEYGRRWDTLIDGYLFEFKSWNKFDAAKFRNQMIRDFEEMDHFRKGPVFWVFEKNFERTALLHQMEAVLNAELDEKKPRLTPSQVELIVRSLPKMIAMKDYP